MCVCVCVCVYTHIYQLSQEERREIDAYIQNQLSYEKVRGYLNVEENLCSKFL